MEEHLGLGWTCRTLNSNAGAAACCGASWRRALWGVFAAVAAVWSHWSWRSPDGPGPDWTTLVQAEWRECCSGYCAWSRRKSLRAAAKRLSGAAEKNGTTVTQQNCYQLRCHGNKATAGPRSARSGRACGSRRVRQKKSDGFQSSPTQRLLTDSGRLATLTHNNITRGYNRRSDCHLWPPGRSLFCSEWGIKDPFSITTESTNMNNGSD